MKKIMHTLFLSCLKATELIEKKYHFNLSLRDQLQLRIHKMMCDACLRYEKHSTILEKEISYLEKSKLPNIDLEALKLRIKRQIEGFHEE